MPIITKWKEINGHLWTTDHRPDQEWQPCACPQHGHSTWEKFNAAANANPFPGCGGNCPFFYIEQMGGEMFAVLECFGQVRRRRLETA
jgi:hypothetical protein